MIDELTIYNLAVKHPATVDLVREVERMARADAIEELRTMAIGWNKISSKRIPIVAIEKIAEQMRGRKMTPYEHIKAKLEHGMSIDADVIRVDIEELASVLEELERLREKAKGDKWYQQGRADEREKVLDEVLKSINFEEKWLHDAIREDNGNYEYNIGIAFSGIKNTLKQLKEKK